MQIPSNITWKVSNSIVFLGLLIFSISCQSSPNNIINESDIKMNKVGTDIEVTPNNGELMVALGITNHTTQPVYIEKSKVFADGRIKNDLFKLTSQGNEIKYMGRTVKRKPPQLKDFIELKPNESFKSILELTHVYDLLEGKNEYEIVYKSKQSTLNTPNNGISWWLESNTVSFTFNKK